MKDEFEYMGGRAAPSLVAHRSEPGIGPTIGSVPPEAANAEIFVVTWQGTLTPRETSDYYLGFRGSGFFRVWIDGKLVTLAYHTDGVGMKLAHLHLEKDKPYALRVDYGPHKGSNPVAELVWSELDLRPSPEVVTASKEADAIVAVVGLTSELEGEEMAVSEEGFKGGDRTSLDLPKPEEDLLEAVAAMGKPLVVVLLNGSALSVNWAQAHANAILDAWYPGEEGGAAVAQTLAGVNNPAGRLPVTFYKSVADLPAFEDYSMRNRTYRYFSGQLLYSFGYGLSYSKFEYSGVKLSSSNIKAGEALTVDADVKNVSARDGDEVVELYLTFPRLAGAPVRALCGFTRVHVGAGHAAHVQLSVKPRDLSYVSEAGDRLIAPGSYRISIGGGQPNTAAAPVEKEFTITGQARLPE